jgi:general secretion pathway protein L
MDIEIGKMGRSFLAWWAGELMSLLPGWVRTILRGDRNRLEVMPNEDCLVLELLGDGKRRRSARIPCPVSARDRTAGRTLRSFLGAADEIVLRLPAEQVLGTTFDLPISAGDALERSVADAIVRRTPFRAGEIYWDWRVRASDMDLERLYVDVLIARRRDVSNAIAAVASMGMAPERIGGPRQPGEEGQRPFNLLPHDARGRSRTWRERLIRPLAFAVIALAVAWSAVALERRKSELEALQERVGSLRAENEAVSEMEERFNRLVDVRSFLVEKKRTAVPFVAILADVTRRIPDGDWLYGYSAKADIVSLQGLSRDASRLPKLLERSDYLGDVSFAAPVRRSTHDHMDDFTLTAKVGLP